MVSFTLYLPSHSPFVPFRSSSDDLSQLWCDGDTHYCVYMILKVSGDFVVSSNRGRDFINLLRSPGRIWETKTRFNLIFFSFSLSCVHRKISLVLIPCACNKLVFFGCNMKLNFEKQARFFHHRKMCEIWWVSVEYEQWPEADILRTKKVATYQIFNIRFTFVCSSNDFLYHAKVKKLEKISWKTFFYRQTLLPLFLHLNLNSFEVRRSWKKFDLPRKEN